MQSNEIRSRFLAFFQKRGHAVIPSASLVPENDPSVLFNTAGMQPLVPYLLGQPHPAGTRLVNVQKCVRTGDLDDIGDNRHFSFFEMMGNWSLGDPSESADIGRAGYFKQEAITWSYEFLTSKEEGLGLDPSRLYVTCFEGDNPSTLEAQRTGAPRDEESSKIWQSLGISESRIYFLGADDNWWSPGDNGPCGPDTEMFYDLTEQGLGELSKAEFLAATLREDLVEIWNDVFMEYEKKDGKVVGKLAKKNVDTGAGLERITAVMQGKKTAYDTDLLAPIMAKISEFTTLDDIKSRRIVADHIRTAVFMIGDGVTPSNTDRGYVLRRLIRRVLRRGVSLGLPKYFSLELVPIIIAIYQNHYPNLKDRVEIIGDILKEEELKFAKPLNWVEQYRLDLEASRSGITKKIKDVSILKDKQTASGLYIYQNYQTYGVPADLSIEIAKELGFNIDEEEFDRAFESHQELSRQGAEKKFKGGLGGESETIIKYHTATHLLNQALHDVLGDKVSQKGSNITDERLRFDFSYGAKMTNEQRVKVEEIVNQKIKENLPIQSVVMPKLEAEATGARHAFGDKYGDMVTVYFIGPDLASAYSKEFCGGPHATGTGTLGTFKIAKEEAVSAGVRRIKAVLQ